MITITECEDALNLPTSKWVGHCYEVVTALLKTGLIAGKPRYGLFLGPIAPTSHFAGRPVARHGWIEREDGLIDLTRWVFEDVEPYIFSCEGTDAQFAEYDIGASSLRTSSNSPPPEHSGTWVQGRQLVFPDFLHPLLEEMFGRVDPCKMQCFWLANQPPTSLGILAKPVYQVFVDAGHGAFIPTDFRQVVFEE